MPHGAAITVVIASDSFLFGEGLSSLLADVPEVEIIGRAHSLSELDQFVADDLPEAVIISVRSLVVTPQAVVTTVRAMRQSYPNMGIVVVSDRVDSFALQLLEERSFGVAFLLDENLPGVEAIVSAVRSIRTGQSVLDPSTLDAFIRRGDALHIDDLTDRESHILREMAHGLSNRAIADELHVSMKTVEKGITAIFLKLGPFRQGLSDRRVSAALVYLRSQSDPFEVEGDLTGNVMSVAVLQDSGLLNDDDEDPGEVPS